MDSDTLNQGMSLCRLILYLLVVVLVSGKFYVYRCAYVANKDKYSYPIALD